MPIAYPYKFSDWYGYDKDCSSVTSFTSAIAETGITCSQPLNQTYYHNGSGTYPVANDVVYTNSAGTTTIGSGRYRLNNNTSFSVLNSGVVAFVDPCN
jgi:hypothetical protein